MSNWLSDREMHEVAGAELDDSGSPIPTRIVSNGEFNPLPQTKTQARVESRIAELADRLAPRVGLSRREFLKTSSGMAAAFLAHHTPDAAEDMHGAGDAYQTLFGMMNRDDRSWTCAAHR